MVRIFNTYGPKMALDDGRVVSNFVTQVPPISTDILKFHKQQQIAVLCMFMVSSTSEN